MPFWPRIQPSLRWTWRSAGLALVLGAAALAAAGIVLAWVQAEGLRARLLTQTQQQAQHVRHTTEKLCREQLAATLRSAAYACRSQAVDVGWLAGDFPAWMDGLYVGDGATATVAIPPHASSEAVVAALTDWLEARPAEAIHAGPSPTPVIVRTTGGDEPITLAVLESTGRLGTPVVVATRIQPDEVITAIVQPMLALTDGLELVPADDHAGPSAQPLAGALHRWALRPTERLLREERRRVLVQTLGYSSLTLLALVTLLVAMWYLVRLARRETALARMKANFVADVSHELKTPLALIRMFAETLHDGRVADAQKQREYYEIITRESTRLTHLIDNILDFSRMDAGRKDYAFEQLDAAEVVRQTYAAYVAELDRRGFAHELTVAADLPAIRADRDALAQVVLNLISNAVKYSQDEKHLVLRLSKDTRRGRHGVLLCVEDRGIGIQPEDRAHLFEGFFRSADGKVRRQRGTGLGLAVVKRIIDAHHGLLDVESRLVKGTTFRIFLPSWESLSASEPGQSTAPTAPSPG